jgi:hypothetical protein
MVNKGPGMGISQYGEHFELNYLTGRTATQVCARNVHLRSDQIEVAGSVSRLSNCGQ